MALVEGAALAVLTAEAHRGAGGQERTEGNGLGHAVVEGALALAHLGALLEQLFDLGVDVEASQGMRSGQCAMVLTWSRVRPVSTSYSDFHGPPLKWDQYSGRRARWGIFCMVVAVFCAWANSD